MLSEDDMKVTRLRDFWPDRPKPKDEKPAEWAMKKAVGKSVKKPTHYGEGRLIVTVYRWILLICLIVGCAASLADGYPLRIIWVIIGAATLYFPTCLALAVFDLVDIHHEQLAISKKRLEVTQKREQEEQDRRP